MLLVKLENREYSFKANGAFMKKYQENFNESMVLALYKVIQEKDPYTCSKLLYSGINESMSFDEWLDSFETPLFIMPVLDKVVEYLVRRTEPTVKPSETEETSKKKTAE